MSKGRHGWMIYGPDCLRLLEVSSKPWLQKYESTSFSTHSTNIPGKTRDVDGSWLRILKSFDLIFVAKEKAIMGLWLFSAKPFVEVVEITLTVD